MTGCKTTRNLINAVTVTGAYVKLTSGSRMMQFVDGTGNPVDPLLGPNLKPGCQFVFKKWVYPGYGSHAYDVYAYTIEGGSGTTWVLTQKADVGGQFNADNVNGWGGDVYHMSDLSSGKGRGAMNTGDNGYPGGPTNPPYSGYLVPDETHFIYASVLDDAGNPDYYLYVDTIAPERAVHPFTRDGAIGSFKCPPRVQNSSNQTYVGRMIAAIAMRVRVLEGALRAGRPAGSTSQDYRIADLVNRFYALERWANGQQGVPTVGSNATYTDEDFIRNGDPA